MAAFMVFSTGAQALRHAVFDQYQRLFPLPRIAAPATVVLIDENSIARYGQWPWPRTRVAELVERIAAHEPAAIALDLAFPEPDRFSPAGLAAELPILPADMGRALRALPSNDERLAAAMRAAPVVLGISAEAAPDPRFPAPPLGAPVVVAPGAATLRRYPGHIASLATLDEAAAGRGVMNAGVQDQVVRVVPLVADVRGSIVPSLGVEALRVALASPLRLAPLGGGLLEMRFGEVRTRLQDDGQGWLRFSPHTDEHAVPAAAVMSGLVDPELLRGKVVLVGVSGLGLLDFRSTPLGEFVPGVMVHAQVVENLYNGVSLVRPRPLPWIEAALAIAGGLLLVLLVPRLSALKGFALAVLLLALLAAAGLAAFARFGVLFDPAWPTIGVLGAFGTMLVATLSEAERQRRQLREQAARLAGEIDAARRIQVGLLPDPREMLAGERRVSVAAALEPARTVGGDFYDAFRLDRDRVFFVVADVSGKGLPAALFMASAQSQLKGAALRGGSVGEILTRAQEDIARANPEQLFVTAFAGRLDLASGELEIANAGHEPPFLRAPGGALERLQGPGGPPLGVIEGFAYPTQRLRLAPGQWICLVTDGATEAMNPSREFYGAERLRAALAALPEEAAPEEIVRAVRADVARFAAGAEPADDITLLALRWFGGSAPALKR